MKLLLLTIELCVCMPSYCACISCAKQIAGGGGKDTPYKVHLFVPTQS